ncbi:hypothetical protein ACXYMP_05615 [Aliiroseovarius sp. CAU 1755]
MEMETKKSRVFVFGGVRGIGNWFARKVLSKHLDRYEVHICDVAPPKTMEPRSDFYWRTIEYKDGFIDDFPEDISDDDVVILSVPVSKLDGLLSCLRRHIRGRAQIVNFCSVQNETNSLIKRELPEDCVIYGLHLLFGPGVSHPAGNNAVVTDLPSHLRNEHVSEFLEYASSSGLNLEYSSSEKHDEMMQVLQVGVHFTFFGFAKYLADQEIDFSDLLKYRTLPAGFFLSFMARALSQPKLTYANIQLQEGAEESRNQIVAGLTSLNADIKSEATPASLESALRSISEVFKQEDLQEGVAATHAAVQAYEWASRQIHDAVDKSRLIGITLPVKDRDEVEVRIGFIQSEERGTIVFDDRLRRVDDSVEGYSYALLRNDASIAFFKKHHGLAFSKKTYPLSKKRFRFLAENYLTQWIHDNVVRARMSFPVQFVRFDAELVERVEQLIPLSVPYVESLKFDNLFIKPNREVTAVCFVTFEASVSTEQAKEDIMKRIDGLVRIT